MSKISNPIWSLFATALLLGINLGLQSARAQEPDSTRANATDSARADNCLVTRPAATPKGQHWYYRTDRQKGRKCWSLHAGAPLVHHAAARPHPKAATSATTHQKPAPPEEAVPPPPTTAQDSAFEVAAPPPFPTNTQPASEATSTATTWPDAAAEAAPTTAAVPFAGAPPAGPADGVQSQQPHVEILRTEPVGVPTQQAAQPSAPAAQAASDAQAAQPSAPAAQAASDAQAAQPSAPDARGGSTAVGNATSTNSADTVPSNAGSEAKDAAAPEAGRDTERGGSDATQQEPAEAASLADTIATLQPTELFFLLAIGLSTVVFLVVIASRFAAKRREPIITEYPAWSNDQFDPPRLDAPQFADEAMDEQWADAEQDVPFTDPQIIDDPHEEEEQDRIEKPALTNRSTAAFSRPSPPDPKSLEPVLRILRQS